MNPSKDDAIFVSQSRTIQKLAAQESCVIIGRCANWILKDDANCFRVFVFSDINDAVSRVVGYLNADSMKAKEEIIKINKARANHYWQYTGGTWTDARNYDLVINSSKVSIDDIVDIISDNVKKKTK